MQIGHSNGTNKEAIDPDLPGPAVAMVVDGEMIYIADTKGDVFKINKNGKF